MAAQKTDGQFEFPAEAYAFAPDPGKPSTWKLRLWESPEAKETPDQVRNAVSELSSSGFKLAKTSISEADRSKLLARLNAAWAITGEKTLPDALNEKKFTSESLAKFFAAADESTGVTLVVGTLKAPEGTKFLPGHPDQAIHAVKFDKSTWDITSAREWMDENHMYCGWVWAEDSSTITFILMERSMFESFRDVPVTSLAAEAEEMTAEDRAKSLAADLKVIKDVEIFQTGEWNGDEYTVKDLNSMVDAFPKVGFQVPIKLGHKEESGAQAWGWVRNLRRVGKKLLCDFHDLPEKLYDAIVDHRYDHISSEIFWEMKRGAEEFSRVLKAVALLGAETPAVSGLKPLREAVFTKSNQSAIEFRRIVLCSKTTNGARKETTKMSVTKTNTTDLRQRRRELSAEIGKANLAGETEKVATLQDELDSVLDAIDAAATAATGVDPLEVKNLKDQITELTNSGKRREERDRVALISAKSNAVPIPALRPIFVSMYDIASKLEASGGKALYRTYKEIVGADPEITDGEISPVKAVDALVDQLKRASKVLFQEHGSAVGELRSEDQPLDGQDVGGEVHRRTQKYMADHPEQKDYVAAQVIVLRSDPELKAAYAAVQN